MDKDRQLAKDLAKGMSFKEKIKHFWYYYRTHTLALIFALVIIVWGAVQCANRIDYDLDISFYSESYFPDESLEAFGAFLETLCEDINDNGSVDAQAYLFSADITEDYLDENAQGVLSRFQNEIALGECPAYIVDEAYKNYIEMFDADMGIIENITEITDAPVIREIFNPGEGVKLYIVSMVEYDTQKGNAEWLKESENMKKVENYLAESLKK